MNEDEVIEYITTAFEGIETQTLNGDTFIFYGSERMFPLVTVVTSNNHDEVSDLNRPGVFRLNIGVSKETYRSLFGRKIVTADTEGGSGYDYAALDRIMPHPVYAPMYWLCVLNPSEATFESSVKPLLAEAYDMAVRKASRRGARGA